MGSYYYKQGMGIIFGPVLVSASGPKRLDVIAICQVRLTEVQQDIMVLNCISHTSETFMLALTWWLVLN